MSTPTLDTIRNCLEGFVPAMIATCDEEGTPNVALLSQVHYVDPEHVALSYQFFNKTRRNVLKTKTASVRLTDPVTVAMYRLGLKYERTQTSGPLFESMKAKLAGIASHSGMEGVFRLLGSDIYRVTSIESVPNDPLPPPPVTRNLLSAARMACDRLLACKEMSELFDATLASLEEFFGIEHAMLLIRGDAKDCLFTVASYGYPKSGIGSEVGFGEGVIGVAAREQVPIRIAHMTSDYRYGAAMRESAGGIAANWDRITQIPFPGLKAPHSQIALPVKSRGEPAGVLFAESAQAMRFWYDHEDALALVAATLGSMMEIVRDGEAQRAAAPAKPDAGADATPLAIRYYGQDGSVFLDNDYLIKGVAGTIFWKLVRDYTERGRCEFTNRELRLDPELRLPAYAENLEARLILLQKRLRERGSLIRIEKSGRGKFRLAVDCPLELRDADKAEDLTA
jgi:adenylate cyclase